MTRQVRNLSASVKERLLNRSRQSGEDLQHVLMRYGLERMMYRLGQSKYANQFVVKGAMLLTVWTGMQYRSTKDLDLLAMHEDSPARIDKPAYAQSCQKRNQTIQISADASLHELL